MLLHKCVSVCTQARARGGRVCERQDREGDRQSAVALMCAPSSAIGKRRRGRKKRQHYRTNASLQTTSLEECVWLPRRVEASHAHWCVWMSIARGDDGREPFSLQARPRSDGPARKSKTALRPDSAGFSFSTSFLSYGLLVPFVFERVSFRYVSLQPDVSRLLWDII